MKLHEYQAKNILKEQGIAIVDEYVVYTLEEARQIIAKLPEGNFVVKAQIHAGGRGKGGGVRIGASKTEIQEHVEAILGKKLITPQTGEQGKIVNAITIGETTQIDKELYLSFLLDRQTSKIVLIASQFGGMDIEQIAATMPEKLHKEQIDPFLGLTSFQARRVLVFLGLDSIVQNKQREAMFLLQNLYRIFIQKDMSLLEFNPLALTKEGDLSICDCKMQIDDNALFRHKNIHAMLDKKEEDPTELEAKEYDLNFISLQGTIGCMVNGAGLAMATMDILGHFGGEPANFLDIGGGATTERVEKALELICQDRQVKCIFVNIFGGIVRCDMIAKGLLQVIDKMKLKLPVIVRLEGTKAEEALHLIQNSPFCNQVTMVSGFAEAAKMAVTQG